MKISAKSAHVLLKKLSSAGSSIGVYGNIQGGSMLPWIKNGDKIKIIPITSKIEKGDIIAFYHGSPARFVAHRVIKTTPYQTITKGDNCMAEDSPLTDEDIAGKIVEIYRGSTRFFFGTGKEKKLIAVLSRINILQIVTRIIKKLTIFSTN